jgi:hypothetical protein
MSVRIAPGQICAVGRRQADYRVASAGVRVRVPPIAPRRSGSGGSGESPKLAREGSTPSRPAKISPRGCEGRASLRNQSGASGVPAKIDCPGVLDRAYIVRRTRRHGAGLISRTARGSSEVRYLYRPTCSGRPKVGNGECRRPVGNESRKLVGAHKAWGSNPPLSSERRRRSGSQGERRVAATHGSPVRLRP